MASVECDSVVVGGGVMGYSAALALAKDGRRTVLLEQFPSPHTRGSSTGQSRITRIANYGAPELNPLMVAALQQWREIQQELGTQLLVPQPMLCIGQGAAMAGMRQAIQRGGETPRLLTVAELNNKFGYNFPSNMEVFEDPAAGILLADKCILGLKSLFEKYGGTVLDRWPVSSIETNVSGTRSVLVHGAQGSTVKAARAVVCAGAWTSTLLSGMGINLPLTPTKIAVCYWRPKTSGFKGHLFVTADDQYKIYGLPSIEYPGLIKVCLHEGLPCDPDNRDLTDVGPLVKRTSALVQEILTCLQPQPTIVENCMYTMTPDNEMILDQVKGCPNIAFGCGFSGTGFKLGPTVGRLLSQMVTGRQLDHDITRFSADRFNVSKY